MKQRARDTLAKLVQIFAEAVSVLEDLTRAEMPTEESAKRTLRNCKGPNMPNPRSLQKLVIEAVQCVVCKIRCRTKKNANYSMGESQQQRLEAVKTNNVFRQSHCDTKDEAKCGHRSCT
ncbi:hypothetical protein RN001_005398 [Aquatica leii]|uniref:Uncharacterized protein n=1 Tax=Aquatica leii TaxID=1421715 RepID=A0AAN7Q0D2_9COLE|nr:hypothetical protein RN001_005398 [Aquatica leii]